jgi:hypothetical protein
MNIGLLWELEIAGKLSKKETEKENEKASYLERNIITASEYYLTKYGKKANCCFVNPGLLNEQTDKTFVKRMAESNKINIVSANRISKNNIWIGVE